MKKIYIAGHTGMVGSSIFKELKDRKISPYVISSKDLDLRNQYLTDEWLKSIKPDIVIIAAAKVGGIYANSEYPADFIYDNLMISSNLINSSYKNGVKKLIFLGSSCIYPKFSKQPIKESELLTSSLEPSNEAYAIAKIAGLKLCQFYRKQYGLDYHSIMPCNLYGLGDNYHPNNSHVIPALIRRIHSAKVEGSEEVVVWGSGTPLREFLYAEDLAKSICDILELTDVHIPDILNMGSDFEFSIKDIASIICKVVGYNGRIVFDTSKPDGTPRKKMDNSEIKKLLNIKYTDFEYGLQMAYKDFLNRVLC